MNANIFFCNGIMSALSSCFISEHIYDINKNNKFYICIEQGTHVLPSYYNILKLIISSNTLFSTKIYASVELRTVSAKNPLNFLKNIIYYRKIYENISLQLKIANANKVETRLWAPTTSRIWQLFKSNKNQLNIIEHGLGEYLLSINGKDKSLKALISKYIGSLFGYPSLSCFSEIWLCSNAVLIPPSQNIIQINFENKFKSYVDNFWNIYQQDYPESSSKLKSLISLVSLQKEKVYLYLPCDEINEEKKEFFIKKQFLFHELQKDSIFIIKNHPNELNANYEVYLNEHGKCISIADECNSYIPVEFIARILNVQNVIGSSSSALFYIKSWLKDVNVYIYNHYDDDMLTTEAANLENQLQLLQGFENK